MVDYKKATGSNGQMMIRDTGTTVEFWITANNGTTYNHALPWGRTVNGDTNNGLHYDYKAGAYWERLGAWTVSYDQTVTFRLFDSGTSGLGGPTTLSAAINRSSAPPKPPQWIPEQWEATRVQGDVDGAGNGGLAIDQFQVRYDEDSSASSPNYQSDDNLDGWFWIEGLTKGTRYYFWVRTHNAKGWSPWSERSTVITLTEPTYPGMPEIIGSSLTSVTLRIADAFSRDTPILERQIGYGKSSAAPTLFQSFPTGSLTITIPNLEVGARYYFWARARNKVGWGPWSARRDNSTLQVPGVWYFIKDVDNNIVPKYALVYVKVSGVWRVGVPMVKIAGMWKPSG